MVPEDLFEQAIKDALRQDELLNLQRGLLTTSERNIAFHIGEALKHILRNTDEFMRYQVDVEYNRQGEGDEPKKLEGENVIPDILIHKRGITYDGDNNANYLYVEIKLIDNFTGKRSSITTATKRKAFARDKHKLMLARSEKHYQHTAFLIINRNAECFVEIDTDAQQEDSFRLLPLTHSRR